MARDPDQMNRIALMALQPAASVDSDKMEKILRYCFDQLCWVRSDAELIALIDGLRAEIGDGE